jgi:hypothetical protein
MNAVLNALPDVSPDYLRYRLSNRIKSCESALHIAACEDPHLIPLLLDYASSPEQGLQFLKATDRNAQTVTANVSNFWKNNPIVARIESQRQRFELLQKSNADLFNHLQKEPLLLDYLLDTPMLKSQLHKLPPQQWVRLFGESKLFTAKNPDAFQHTLEAFAQYPPEALTAFYVPAFFERVLSMNSTETLETVLKHLHPRNAEELKATLMTRKDQFSDPAAFKYSDDQLKAIARYYSSFRGAESYYQLLSLQDAQEKPLLAAKRKLFGTFLNDFGGNLSEEQLQRLLLSPASDESTQPLIALRYKNQSEALRTLFLTRPGLANRLLSDSRTDGEEGLQGFLQQFQTN